MLVGTQGGASYGADQYRTWLHVAGFKSVEHVRLPGPTGLIIGLRE